MWERAGRLQDACDGSYFNGLPLFTGGGKGKEPDMIVSFLMKRAWRADYLFLFPRWKRNTWISNVSFGFRFNSVPFGFVLVRVRVQPPKVGAPQEIGLRISVDHCLVGAITKTLIEIKVLVKHMGIQ